MKKIKEIIGRIKKPVSNEKGFVSYYGILLLALMGIIIFLATIAFGIKYYSTQNIVNEVHEAMNKIVTSSVTTNSDETYASKREAYSGAYTAKTHDEVLVLLTEDAITEKLTKMLNLNTPSGKLLGKYELNEGVYTPVYYISDIELIVDNPGLTEKDERMEAKIKLKLHIPFQIGSFVNKSNNIELIITSVGVDTSKY